MTEGIIFNIQRFSIHDGPGIRTTVFLKGCPLRCLWCHNPESWKKEPEILYSRDKCITCRCCEQGCLKSCHVFSDTTHQFNRQNCNGCMACIEKCPVNALELAGRKASVEEIMDEVMKDEPFYTRSGGGMTLSGGEPLMQFDFTLSLLKAARSKGLHTCIETSGYADLGKYQELLPYVNMFLYDLKETHPELHVKYTGVANDLILGNLLSLDRAGASILLRCPIIPGLNDREDHFRGIASLAELLKNVQEIHLLPYHELGNSKLTRLGKPATTEAIPTPVEGQIKGWAAIVQSLTSVQVN